MSRVTWLNDVFRPLAVGGMMGCIALSLVRLIQLFFPGWNGGFMVVGCVLAAVEANYSYRLVRSRHLSGSQLVSFRAAEIALFLILLRVGAYAGEPWRDIVRDVQAWPRDPLRILDLEVLYAFVLVLLSWSVSTKTTYDLERIGEPPVRDKYYVPPVEALTDRFFWGGALLLWIAGVTRIGIASLLDLSRPSVPGLIGNVLLYFVLGLIMLGQMQFTRLSERWRKEGMAVPARLIGGWVRYTLILIVLAGLVAFVLPTAYTLPLLDIAAILLNAIFYVFHVIFQLVILLSFLLLIPLLRLLGMDPDVERPDAVPPPDLDRLMPDAPDAAGSPPWFEIVRSLLFWAVALTVVFYIIRSYLRDRPELVAAFLDLRPLRAVRHLLRALRDQVAALFGAARSRIPDRIRSLRPGRRGQGGEQEGAPHLFPLSELRRRKRTLYYYLSTLRRAAQRGYPRRKSQTPYEYDTELASNVPQVEVELDRLTDAFVEAQYSRHDIEREREDRLRADWRKIRAALRSLRQQSDSDEESGPDQDD